ncbi:hypothetical protein [Microbacterium sp. EST19A]|uniref:hypothetical protein n=1 Tax=Microbacterium sp. EST19A TaxID=2862681 RepID=UPI001CBA9B6F|nr:hypothetical protein [Microbacterium sp. EST19A]
MPEDLRAFASDDRPPSGLLLAAAAASAHPSSDRSVIGWRFPALPAAPAETARATWGITITSDDTGVDPRDGAGFSTLLAHARSEQIVRALARHTNLVLPAATALVVGDGPIAETIADALSSGGTRVVRAADAALARLRAHLGGLRITTPTAPWPPADLVITTGEGHAPLDPATFGSVAIDASIDSTGLTASAGEEVRPFVRRVGAHSWVTAAPGPFDAGDGAPDRPNRLADLLVALSILHTRTDAADARLAELVLA